MLNELSRYIHAGNVQRGFWEEKTKDNKGGKNIGELLMLVTSELGEALEALRKGRRADIEAYREHDANLADFDKGLFEVHIKDTFEDEIADAIIRLLDMCDPLVIDIDFHIREKLKYNSTRAYKHGKLF